MNRRNWVLVGIAGLVGLSGIGWFGWKIVVQPYGEADLLWTEINGRYEAVEMSYHPGGSPLDAKSQFLPIARALCEQEAGRVVPFVFGKMGKTKADFFRITFHYGKGSTDFYLFADFAFKDGKVDCQTIFTGKPPEAPDTGKQNL